MPAADPFLLLYARIPRIRCRRKCQASCGPIEAFPAERERFERMTGKPFPDPLAVLQSKTPECPYLNALGACDVYQNRPAICRLWGVVKAMRCPFGCEPERWLSDAEARAILLEARG